MANIPEKGILRIWSTVERKRDTAFLDTLHPPENKFTVNVDTKRDYLHDHYTVNGDIDFRKYNTARIHDCLDELRTYHHYFYTAKEAVTTIFLWKGHYRVRLCHRDLFLPLAWILMFVTAQIVVEYTPSCLALMKIILLGKCFFIANILQKMMKRTKVKDTASGSKDKTPMEKKSTRRPEPLSPLLKKKQRVCSFLRRRAARVKEKNE